MTGYTCNVDDCVVMLLHILWAFRLIKLGMEAADSGNPQAKNHAVTVHTVERWKADSDKAMHTSMWLTYDK